MVTNLIPVCGQAAPTVLLSTCATIPTPFHPAFSWDELLASSLPSVLCRYSYRGWVESKF